MTSSYEMLGNYSPTNYRCDSFTKEHNGMHILFFGDSFAAGDGLEKEDTWAYKTYEKIKETTTVDGYFNIGCSGISISESIDQFFKYCYHYGNPDIAFFVTTEIGRDQKYAKDGTIDKFVTRSYMYLEQYCRSANIKLFSFSWIKSIDNEIKEPNRYWWKDGSGKQMLRPLWTEQSIDQSTLFNVDILNQFETFYSYEKDEMMRSVFEFDSKTKTPLKSLWATDLVHPGTSFHDFYSDFIYNKYLENK